ncbi:metal-dependent hydrolase [[Eubacterium] cellulosolvens]
MVNLLHTASLSFKYLTILMGIEVGMMVTEIRFLGYSAFEITNEQGIKVFIDPYLDDNPVSPIKTQDLEKADLILVTHGAVDHLGDTVKIARKFEAPVICGGDVRAHLLREGLPSDKVVGTIWGITVEKAGIRVRSIESRHWSNIIEPDGTYLAGQPMGFIVYADPGVRIYHAGDTSLFSDLKLIGELYKPNIGLVHITMPIVHTGAHHGAPSFITGEMTPYEAALAAQWLALEYVIPMHFDTTDNPDIKTFVDLVNNMASDSKSYVKPVVLKAGEVFKYQGKE